MCIISHKEPLHLQSEYSAVKYQYSYYYTEQQQDVEFAIIKTAT